MKRLTKARQIKCSFAELDRSLKSLNGYRLHGCFRHSFTEHWKPFRTAVTTMKNAYRHYWEAIDDGVKTDVRRKLRMAFNLSQHRAVRTLYKLLCPDLASGNLTRKTREKVEDAEQEVVDAIYGLCRAVNAPLDSELSKP